MKDWKVFPDLEQRLQPGGVQQTVEDLGPVDVLAHRLSHLVDHIRQDLTQACSAPTPERLLEQKQEVVPGPAVKYISPPDWPCSPSSQWGFNTWASTACLMVTGPPTFDPNHLLPAGLG